MVGKTLGTLTLAVAIASPALAQQPKVELTGNIGFTFSSGISGDTVEGGDGNFYNRIEPDDAVSYAFTIGFFASEGAEVGFQWNRQQSKLLVGGPGIGNRDVGDMNVDNYHGYFAYNFGDYDVPVRPYVMIGLGATNYGSVEFNVAGQPRSTGSVSRFSTTWGAGVKFYAGPNVGLKIGARWTPTYITSESAGWWCDPWWGCYVVGNAKYSHQFDLSGGIALRF